MTSGRKEFESHILMAVVGNSHDSSVDDLREEVENFTSVFGDFKKELFEDLCQVIGLYVDRYAMEQYEKHQPPKNKQ